MGLHGACQAVLWRGYPSGLRTAILTNQTCYVLLVVLGLCIFCYSFYCDKCTKMHAFTYIYVCCFLFFPMLSTSPSMVVEVALMNPGGRRHGVSAQHSTSPQPPVDSSMHRAHGWWRTASRDCINSLTYRFLDVQSPRGALMPCRHAARPLVNVHNISICDHY